MSDDNSYIEEMNKAFFIFVDRIMTLSTGALALSITFRTSFSQCLPKGTLILMISWSSFVVAIIAGLFLLYGRVDVYRRTAQIYKALFKTSYEELAKLKEGFIVPPARWFPFAKWALGISFGLGIIALAAYAMMNLT
jgi:hypothetical protein